MAELKGIRVAHKIIKPKDSHKKVKKVLEEVGAVIQELREKGAEIHLVIHVDEDKR